METPDLTTYRDDEIQQIIDAGLPADTENGSSPDDVEDGLLYQAAIDERARRIDRGVWTGDDPTAFPAPTF